MQFLDQSIAKKLRLNDSDEFPVSQIQPNIPAGDAEVGTSGFIPISPSEVFGNLRTDDLSRQGLLGPDFASQLFGTKEAEDFSMFQLQPGFYDEDLFGGGLDQYYNSVMTKGDESQTDNIGK